MLDRDWISGSALRSADGSVHMDVHPAYWRKMSKWLRQHYSVHDPHAQLTRQGPGRPAKDPALLVRQPVCDVLRCANCALAALGGLRIRFVGDGAVYGLTGVLLGWYKLDGQLLPLGTVGGTSFCSFKEMTDALTNYKSLRAAGSKYAAWRSVVHESTDGSIQPLYKLGTRAGEIGKMEFTQLTAADELLLPQSTTLYGQFLSNRPQWTGDAALRKPVEVALEELRESGVTTSFTSPHVVLRQMFF